MAHAPKREYLPNRITGPAQALLPSLVAWRILPEPKADVEYIDPSFTAEAMAAQLKAKGAVIVGGFFQSYQSPPKTRVAAGTEHFYFPKAAALPDMKARPPLAVIVFGMVKVGSADCVRLMVPGLPKPLLMSFNKFKACSRPLEGHREALEAGDTAARAAAARSGAAGPGDAPAPAALLTPAERARQIAFVHKEVFPRLMAGMPLSAIFPSGAATTSDAESSFRQSCFMHLARTEHAPAGITDAAHLSDDLIRAAIRTGHLTPEDIVAPATTSAPAAVSAPAKPDAAATRGVDDDFAARMRKGMKAKRAHEAARKAEAEAEAAAKAAAKTEAEPDKGARLDAAVAAEASGGHPAPAAAPGLASSGGSKDSDGSSDGRPATAGATLARPAPTTGPALPSDEPEAVRDHAATRPAAAATRDATRAALRSTPPRLPDDGHKVDFPHQDTNAWGTCRRRTARAGMLCVTRGVPAAFSLYNLYRLGQAGIQGAWWVTATVANTVGPEVTCMALAWAGGAVDGGNSTEPMSDACRAPWLPGMAADTCPAPGSSWF